MNQPAADDDFEHPKEQPRRREPVFNLPPIILLLVTLCAGLHLIRAYVLTPTQDFELIVRAAFIPLRYSGAFEIDLYAFSSPITYAFLHGSIAHLLINMIWLAAFGSPLANRLGAVRMMLFWIFTALAAAALHYMIYPLDQAPLVGASGAISGMMGAAARFGFRTDQSAGKPVFHGPRLSLGDALTSRTVVIFLAVWMVINLVTGLGMTDDSNPIAWEAHIGGFLAGFLCLALFDRKAGPAFPH